MKLFHPYFVVYKDPRRASNPAVRCAPDTDFFYPLNARSIEEAEPMFFAFVENFGSHGEYHFRLVDMNAIKEEDTVLRELRPKPFEAIDETKKRKRKELTAVICDRCGKDTNGYPLFVAKMIEGKIIEEICQECVVKSGGSLPDSRDGPEWTPNRNPKPTFRRI